MRAFIKASSRPRECDHEGRTLVLLAGCTDLATMPAHDPVHDGQPDARARKIARRVQSLKRLEELIGMLHPKSRPVVAQGEDVPMIVGNPIHLDARIVAPAGELPGVAEQIVEYDAKQGTVGHDLHPILDLDRNL